MNTASNSIRLDASSTNPPGSTIWENAWVDCLIQACVAAPWIIVSAVCRLLLRPHT